MFSADIPGTTVSHGRRLETVSPMDASMNRPYSPARSVSRGARTQRGFTLVDTMGFIVSIPHSQITRFASEDAPDPANCAAVYQDAFSSGTQPLVTTLTSGC
jgi:hypothetical protein